jgi:hypothetical protein
MNINIFIDVLIFLFMKIERKIYLKTLSKIKYFCMYNKLILYYLGI